MIVLPAILSRLASAQSSVPCSNHLAAGPTVSLEAVIHEACLTPPANAIVPLDQKITSYAVFNDSKDYILGYYVLSPDGLLSPPFHLLRYRKASYAWSHREIKKATPRTKPSDGVAPDYDPCFGSVLSIIRAGRFFYVETHINPSAGCTLVFSPDLKLQDNLYGWVVASFSSGTVVFQESVVHFAPTHPLKLSLYEPQRRTTTQTYPRRHDQLRAAYVQRLQKIPANQRCHGDNCYDEVDPELLEASLGTIPREMSKSAIAVNERTHALAFLAVYSPRGLVSLEAEDLSEWREEVVYVYRLSPGLPHRVFLLSVMQERYRSATFDDLLKPEMMARVFPMRRGPEGRKH